MLISVNIKIINNIMTVIKINFNFSLIILSVLKLRIPLINIYKNIKDTKRIENELSKLSAIKLISNITYLILKIKLKTNPIIIKIISK